MKTKFLPYSNVKVANAVLKLYRRISLRLLLIRQKREVGYPRSAQRLAQRSIRSEFLTKIRPRVFDMMISYVIF